MLASDGLQRDHHQGQHRDGDEADEDELDVSLEPTSLVMAASTIGV